MSNIEKLEMRGRAWGLGRLAGRGLPRNSAAPGPVYSHDLAITITQAAFEAIRATLPDGTPRSVGPDGQMRIWLDNDQVDALRALRRTGEI